MLAPMPPHEVAKLIASVLLVVIVLVLIVASYWLWKGDGE